MKEKGSARQITEKWSQITENGDTNQLTEYLKEHSNLPGPRTNLTLAFKTSELLTKSWTQNRKFVQQCFNEWTSTEDEYLLLTRNMTLGYILSKHDEPAFIKVLYRENFNPMWRRREAVTLGLQKTLVERPGFTLQLLRDWADERNWLLRRNVLMVLAHPQALKVNSDVREELRRVIHEAMDAVRDAEPEERRSDGFKLLKKSLGFILSVAAGYDDRVIDDMQRWASTGNRYLKSIVKQNLKKKRLQRSHPDEVKALLESLT